MPPPLRERPNEPERPPLLDRLPTERTPERFVLVETRPNPVGFVLPTPEALPPTVREENIVGRAVGR